MSNIPSTRDVPSINILDADATSTLSDGVEPFPADIYAFSDFSSADTGLFHSSRGLQPEYFLSSFSGSQPELEAIDIPDLSLLNTTSQAFITGHDYAIPYSAIMRENMTPTSPDGCLVPSNFTSPAPSPTSSFDSSLSPSSHYDYTLSDGDSPVSPSPATPDQGLFWLPQAQGHNHSNDSLALHPSSCMASSDSILSLGPPTHRRTKSVPIARREPVASKAMLEANSRRRRHPATFKCNDCDQTFTALFSLKRHSQSHTGERPFACSIAGCSQRFFNSSDCKRHEKSKKRHKDLMVQ